MKKLVTLSNINYLQKLKDNLIDGVIIGQPIFSNRFNSYFTNNEVNTIINKCEELNLEVYINVNDIIFEDNINDLKEYLLHIIELKINGIFYNDIAINYLASEYGFEDKLIYNPDTLMSNYYDINVYLDKGLKSVMISKEITLDEINNILSCCEKKLSMIIHGRLNMSYSKRHFIKNYYDYLNKENNLNDNLNLSLIEATREYKMPILETNKGCSIYTDFTLESFDQINELNNNGLAYGIIDDIFMDQEELFDTINVYNNVLSKEVFLKKYKAKNYNTGYYFKKTNLVK